MNVHNDVIKRNNVTVLGKGNTTLLLAHGFGCDQNMCDFYYLILKMIIK